VSEPAHGPSYAELQAQVAKLTADLQDSERLRNVMTDRATDAGGSVTLAARITELEATLDDVARGSTHELVRYLLEKLIAAEKKGVDLEQQVEVLYDGDSEDEARIAKAKAIAERWRIAACKVPFVAMLKRETLERCADEIDEALRGPATAAASRAERLAALKAGGCPADKLEEALAELAEKDRVT
jgi:hypothetical protein